MCHGEVPPEPLLLPEQVAADHPLEGAPLRVVVAEAVLQVRLLHPRQAQRDLGVLSGDALKQDDLFNLGPCIYALVGLMNQYQICTTSIA